ncbi:MAG TPA: aldo/keto reductase [Rhodanobacteraceae bacterium]|nr:aldo/keto reductase [Rhodanobacteraceae bacterium]
MELRKLGRSELRVAPLALGGNVFGWTADEKTSFAVLDAFVAAGGNLIDTADSYSHWVPGHKGGESETIIGKWLKRSGKRDAVVLATKVGKPMGGRRGLSPGYIASAVEDSLRRLQVDVIDLYQAHEDDEDTPLVETLGAFARLIEQGKVRAIGASNFTAARLGQSLQVSADHRLPRYESLQPEYNLMQRHEYEEALEPLVREHEVGVISYYALASGFLSGKYRSREDLAGRARGGAVEKYLNARGLRVLRALDDAAARHEATPAQVSLAWLMARPGVTAPIASATSVAQLEELAGAMRLKLDAGDIEALDRVSAAA